MWVSYAWISHLIETITDLTIASIKEKLIFYYIWSVKSNVILSSFHEDDVYFLIISK
jgi:hypothetical protein